ncbi:SMI1/KNR4 family protein [Spartinivicinus poritis]|uniref:SMI1/KNR4 family protein n=1 Tax=Spartinivicinus poritis TaxID=2994640 RepID=A0ABT5UEV3_9GAMM|nr:SMI1/KNR4 family protein [Spartinivicinus sp. A2-2]MDE1463619.1 SMI1/KNR4 family protein [Spartinivicinus sp. A2-2]
MNNVSTAYQRLCNWFSTHDKAKLNKSKRTSSKEEIKKLESTLQFNINQELKDYLKINEERCFRFLDDESFFTNMELYTNVSSIILNYKLWTKVSSEFRGVEWNICNKIQPVFYDTYWIPFGNDNDDVQLHIDMNPRNDGVSGQVIYIDNEACERFVIANSISEFFDIMYKILEKSSNIDYDKEFLNDRVNADHGIETNIYSEYKRIQLLEQKIGLSYIELQYLLMLQQEVISTPTVKSLKNYGKILLITNIDIELGATQEAVILITQYIEILFNFKENTSIVDLLEINDQLIEKIKPFFTSQQSTVYEHEQLFFIPTLLQYIQTCIVYNHFSKAVNILKHLDQDYSIQLSKTIKLSKIIDDENKQEILNLLNKQTALT